MGEITSVSHHMQTDVIDVSEAIQIDVETLYVESESDPDNNRFVFAYTITIRNVGDTPARLMTRHWVIRDGKQRQSPGSPRRRCRR